MYGQASAPEKVACSVTPSRRDALAASLHCSIAQDVRASGLPRTCGAAKPSKAVS
jgi:hypothetical protein